MTSNVAALVRRSASDDVGSMERYMLPMDSMNYSWDVGPGDEYYAPMSNIVIHG